MPVAMTACAADPETRAGDATAPAVIPDAGLGDTGVTPGAACGADNPFCNDASSAPQVEMCGNEPIDLSPAGINIMVAIDGAASMATHWPRIQEAIAGLRQAHPKAGVGMHVFWGEVVENIDQGFAKSNWCGNTKNQVLEVGDHAADALRSFLGSAPPGPSFLGGLFETSPVIEPLNYYLTNATKLADTTRTNYLLFVTNGNDNCFGSVYATKKDKLVAYEKLAVEMKKRNIRVIPIGFDAAAVPGASGRGGTTVGRTDLEVLSTLLEHGGSGLKEVPKVDDPAKLAQVIAQVGLAAKNCRFAIPTALDAAQQVNPFQLDFAINGKLVTRDRKRLDGWNFVDGNLNEVELFGSACAAIQADAKLEARKTCTKQVCGTAAIKVETRPRSVQYLLDGSASRIECVDGSFGCLIPPNSIFFMRTSLTFWETVQHALGQSLVEPINDDIEFGLQFFPSKQAATLSCDVATAPEVPPAPGTAIQMMSQMLEKIPLGFTPIVQVLENVANAPGRLADPGVLGAVVVLSDGGDTCLTIPQEEMVARLGAAARKLREQGVKTYAVRFGSAAGKSAEQDAQLLAIVKEGGTDRSDPADPSRTPYVDAKSDAELSAALSEISDTLATCSFGLGELPPKADKANANLYLNGEVIPFDSTQTQTNGWSWADPEKTSVQLYGESCKAFKTQRRTSVVVEFGCAPVVLF
ncbi:MAG TPA: hypothetical protein VFZ61_31145 [Polyangiales bacterium]